MCVRAWVISSLEFTLLLDGAPPPLVEKSFGNCSKQTLHNKYGTVMTSTAGLSPCGSLLDTDSGWKYVRFTGDSGPSPTLQKSLDSGL